MGGRSGHAHRHDVSPCPPAPAASRTLRMTGISEQEDQRNRSGVQHDVLDADAVPRPRWRPRVSSVEDEDGAHVRRQRDEPRPQGPATPSAKERRHEALERQQGDRRGVSTGRWRESGSCPNSSINRTGGVLPTQPVRTMDEGTRTFQSGAWRVAPL